MDKLDLGNGAQQVDNNITALDESKTINPDNNPKNTGATETTPASGDNNQQANSNQNSSTGELEKGTVIEFDGNNYTVSENGDIVDDKGNVFKAAADVAEWLKSVNVDDDSNKDSEPLSLASIQNALNVTVTTEDGTPAEFTDDAAGVKAYIQAVLDIKSNELQQAALNKLYNEKPLLKQFQDYLIVNNGNPRGFGELPDRTGITLDKDNLNQLRAVIKVAAAEFGNNSINDNYIKYLEDTGALYDVAYEQLQALQEKDKQTREYIAREARAREEQEAKEVEEYYNNVNKIIAGRNIAGYKLPESFVKEVNGQKITLTPNDFFNYLYKQSVVDEQGNRLTGYQRDLANQSQEDALNTEMLQAWLMFTGGSYKDLVDMAIKNEQVKKLIITSNQNRAAKTIKINKPKSKVDFNDIVL